MTGWRLGWSVWPKNLIEPATRLAINDHSCVNAPAQWAGVEALKGPQDAVEKMVEAFDERRKAMHKMLNDLPGISCQMPAGAFYAFPNISKTGMDARTLQNRMLDEIGVATVAGTSFGKFGEGYLRFSYANSLENIVTAMDRIRGLLQG